LSHIKTKEKVNGIKIIDKGVVASERMRSAFIRTKQNASALVDNNAASVDEYSSNSAQNLADNTLHDASYLAVSGSKTVMRKSRELVEDRIKRWVQASEGGTLKEAASAVSEPTAYSEPSQEEPTRTESTPNTASARQTKAYEQGREFAKKQTVDRQKENARTRVHTRQTEVGRAETLYQHQVVSQWDHTIKTADRPTRTIKQTAKSTGKVVAKSTEGAVQTSQRTVKTAEQSSKMAVMTSQAAAKATQKATAASVKATQRAAHAAKTTAKAAAVVVKTEAKTVATAVKAIVAAVKELIATIAAGGWVAVLVIVVVVLIVAVIASPFGIFFSGEIVDKKSVPASAAIAQISYDFNSQLEAIQDGDYDEIVLEGAPADWTDVLAVFAVKVAGAEDASATYVASLDAERVEKLKAVFYDMTSISSYVEVISHPDSDPDDEIDDGWSESILHITVSGISAEEAAANYGFSAKQKEILVELLAEREMLRELIGDLHGELIEAKEVLKALPEDLSPERREIVMTACSLVGKVNYFWGGKSRVIGWDSRWGTLQKVWADGSSTTGTWRPFGLDCSGFVDWVFYNATDGAYYPGQGGGAANQHSNCVATTWKEAQPGDLVFYPGDEHVGIVAGFDENGDILIIHCASGYNNVVITGIEGFSSIGAPDYFGVAR